MNEKLSKIQIRAAVLSIISEFKNLSTPTQLQIDKAVEGIIALNDEKSVAPVLLKEISQNDTVYDNVLAYILFATLKPEVLSEKIIEMLSDKTVNDSKKLYLINILKEQGHKIDYDFMNTHIDDLDMAIEEETRRFLVQAKFSPEVQIDFFDFYFSVDNEDKDMLLNSILADFTSDELANIVTPFVYLNNDSLNASMVEALGISKSNLAYEPLEWVLNNNENSELRAFAKKALAQLKISGIRKPADKQKLYSEILCDSKPIGFWFSMPDGNSNLSCVFARQKNDGHIQTFFTVFNLRTGPVSCFGFDNVTREDFELILLKFFKSSLKAFFEPEDGKVIFDTLANKALDSKRDIPYEFICYRVLTYDILASNVGYFNLLSSGLKDTGAKIANANKILNSDIFSSWFYAYNRYKLFDELVDEIDLNKILDIDTINALIDKKVAKILSSPALQDDIKEKILFQCFIMMHTDLSEAACALYSIMQDESVFEYFVNATFKRSVYEHYFALSSLKEADNRFQKNVENDANFEFAKLLVDEIEKRWI